MSAGPPTRSVVRLARGSLKRMAVPAETQPTSWSAARRSLLMACSKVAFDGVITRNRSTGLKGWFVVGGFGKWLSSSERNFARAHSNLGQHCLGDLPGGLGSVPSGQSALGSSAHHRVLHEIQEP